jgi:TonB family protein
MWPKNTRAFGAILVVASLSSCATGYQSSGFTGGYTEKKITDSAYVVTFGGNGFASKDRIYYFWTYRCAELTLEKGYSLFSVRSNQSTGPLNPPADSIRPAVYYPEDGAELIKTRASSGAPIVTPVPGGGGPPKWTYSGTVLMYQKPLPEELLWAVDAQAVVATLKPYVASNGSAPAPSRDELFKRAYIAHARISVGPSIAVSASDPAADAGKPPRSAEQIAEVVESERLVMLQSVYREYVTHLGTDASRADTSGHVAVAFSVSPNGQVTHSKITSASFLDPRFNSAIEELVRQTEFGPKDVVATDVKNFDISFGPW